MFIYLFIWTFIYCLLEFNVVFAQFWDSCNKKNFCCVTVWSQILWLTKCWLETTEEQNSLRYFFCYCSFLAKNEQQVSLTVFRRHIMIRKMFWKQFIWSVWDSFPQVCSYHCLCTFSDAIKKNFGAENQMETQHSRCYINCQSWPYLSSWLGSHWCCCVSAAKSAWNKNLFLSKVQTELYWIIEQSVQNKNMSGG